MCVTTTSQQSRSLTSHVSTWQPTNPDARTGTVTPTRRVDWYLVWHSPAITATSRSRTRTDQRPGGSNITTNLFNELVKPVEPLLGSQAMREGHHDLTTVKIDIAINEV